MEKGILSARVLDAARLCESTDKPRYLGFLSSFEASEAETLLRSGTVRYTFYGGYPDADRTMLACLPEWCEEPQFPMCALTFRFDDSDGRLFHRDFLGTLINIGLSREAVGDILVEPGRAVVFLRNEVRDFVTASVNKVGGKHVLIYSEIEEPLPHMTTEGRTASVASMRLDCLVAAFCGVARSRAEELISEGRAAVNTRYCKKPSQTVAVGDRVTIMGKGRFAVDAVQSRSKKGRIILKYSKYL